MRQLSVAGTYATGVTLLAQGNTCGAVQVQDNPTVVAHTAGAHTLSLTHAGNTYSGTVTDTGAFIVPQTALGGGAFQISIAGQFASASFIATVSVVQAQPSCGYQVTWTGTKSGPPNTFP